MDAQPKKSLGQHWLTDEATLESICDAASITASDAVLEIGPGRGDLTRQLVRRAGQVVAVEFDKQLASDLANRVAADNLSIIASDILRFDFSQMPADYKIVSNIPYYLTSNLIKVISETSNPPISASLLVQKEVAERVTATPGSMSILSVTAQFYWQIGLGPAVPAKLFTPPPKVDSQLLIMERRSAPLFPGLDSRDFFRLVKAGFSQKRKTLLNSLSGGLQLPKAEIEKLATKADIQSGRRAQTLSLEEWRRLYDAWQA